MRQLSENFIHTLKAGFLSPLLGNVLADKDLDLHIRDNYLNIYYKGNSLLKLAESGSSRFKVEIHPKFLGDQPVSDLVDEETTATFIERIPGIKEKIVEFGKHSLETEYEQLIIRANNREKRNNPEYFLVDRQYSIKRERFDLMGIYWKRRGRARGQTIAPCLMEVKFALNTDISKVHRQLNSYYNLVRDNLTVITEDLQSSFKQRLGLGLYDQDPNRLEAMKTLQISRKLEDFQFILIFVDYNPYSKQLDLEKISSLPFADQIKIFFSGFAMWGPRLETIGK